MDMDAEILRSRARRHYATAALFRQEAHALAESAPDESALLLHRESDHRRSAQLCVRVLVRLRAPLGAQLEELLSVHDVSFALEITARKDVAQ